MNIIKKILISACLLACVFAFAGGLYAFGKLVTGGFSGNDTAAVSVKNDAADESGKASENVSQAAASDDSTAGNTTADSSTSESSVNFADGSISGTINVSEAVAEASSVAQELSEFIDNNSDAISAYAQSVAASENIDTSAVKEQVSEMLEAVKEKAASGSATLQDLAAYKAAKNAAQCHDGNIEYNLGDSNADTWFMCKTCGTVYRP